MPSRLRPFWANCAPDKELRYSIFFSWGLASAMAIRPPQIFAKNPKMSRPKWLATDVFVETVVIGNLMFNYDQFPPLVNNLVSNGLTNNCLSCIAALRSVQPAIVHTV